MVRPSSISADDFLKRGQLSEKIGLSLYQAALQAKNRKTFRERIKRSISAYRHAGTYYRKLQRDEKGRILRSQAMEKFLTYWIARLPSEKKQLLEEAWRLTKKSLRHFEAHDMGREYAQTYYDLSLVNAIGLFYDEQVKDRVRKLAETVEPGRKSVAILRDLGRREELARALTRTALFLDSLADRISDPARIRLHQREALTLWEDALRTSEKAAIRETAGPPDGFYRILDQSQNLTIAKRAQDLIRGEKNNLAMGWLQNRFAHYTFWESDTNPNPTNSRKLLAGALQYAEESAECYDSIGFTSPITGVLWAHSPYAEYFLQASGFEDDQEKALLLLEKSVQASAELLKLARQSGYPDVVHYALHVKSRAETSLARVETSRLRRKQLLRTALEERIESATIVRRVEPRISWNVGISFSSLANVQVRLSELEENPRIQKELLFKAVANKGRGLACNSKFLGLLERSEGHVLRSPLGNGYRELGDYLMQLFRVTKDETHLRNAARTYVKSSDWFRSIPRYDKLAQCHWKAAEAYDLLQLYTLSSEQFSRASRAYAQLGKKIPELKDFSNEHARYMTAWSEIEQARSNHVRFDFSYATKSYYTAARIHRNTKRWRFLAHYYSAWANLEHGESLSKDGRHELAAQAFHEAASMFAESRISLKERLASVNLPDERQMVEKLMESPRDVYCDARGLIEEAVFAEDHGDHHSSSEKFALASAQLREAAKRFEFKDSKEIRFLSILCKAWQLSSSAMLQDSNSRLQDAQRLFEEAVKASPSEEAATLTSGHLAFCKALIASESFTRTLARSWYEEASREFDRAAQHYLNLGFKIACYHAIAKRLFIDGSFKLSLIEAEREQKKKAENYRLAVGLLRESARMFGKAHQPEKMERTLSLLGKVGLESRIADHLTEILDAASDTPTNVAFPTPTRGHESAVGLDRLETAHLEATLSVSQKSQSGTSQVEAEIGILNVGDVPIRVLRLEEAIPEQAELAEVSINAVAKGRSLVPEELRISPKKEEKIRLILKIESESILSLQPKILFLDKTGSEREHRLEPSIIPTSPIIQFLASSFIRDYAERRLALDSCGWRTLMDVVKALKIPKSHVYGEPRYGRPFGRQFEGLLNASFVEYRTFPGERGRGGEITKTRVHLDNQLVKSYIQQSIDTKTHAITNLPNLTNSELLSIPTKTDRA